jgi:cell division protein FtsN
VRAAGHPVRVRVQRGEAESFVVRHGNFVEREEAEARREELALAGFTAGVVQAK